MNHSSGRKYRKIKIELQYGTSLVEIENKLPKDAFFEVETPNATIGVRGTIFETCYNEEEKGYDVTADYTDIWREQ